MSTVVILLILLSLTITLICTNSDNKISVTIFAITNKYNLSDDSVQTTGGHWLAIQHINNDSNFLDKYVFNLEVLDAERESQEALQKALNVIDATQYKSTATHIYFPLIIGAPWSKLSIAISPILGINEMGSISCGSTSVALSDTTKYPYFYRTTPTDALQVNGILALCYQFGWREIAVVYVMNDEYGSYFSLGIQRERKQNKSHPIDITSIAISNDETQFRTYYDAATQIKESNIYVIVVVSHSDSTLFDVFKEEGLLSYPYYMIGTDGWFNTAQIKKLAINEQDLQGFIGLTPWNPDSLSDNDLYSNKYPEIYAVNKAKTILEQILVDWSIEEKNGLENLHTYSSEVLSTMVYAYDAMYVIANVIEKMGDIAITDGMIDINTIDRIITEELNFTGASGRVAFNANGDRKYELYSIGNALANGTVAQIGFFYQGSDGTIKLEMDANEIQWPVAWGKVEPRLDVVLRGQIITIDTAVSVGIFVCLGISLLIAFIFMVLICYYRKNMIIIHASWKLNVSMSIGAILLYVGAVLFGIDESYIFDHYALTIFCNLRLWITNISCTLLFMPLFLKTYRLGHIFKVLVKTVFSDAKLFVYTAICIVVDIILLTLFTFLPGLQRNYEIAEEWMWIGTCSFAVPQFHWLFFVVILWKLCELTFGIYCGLIVSRIEDGTNILRRYDETGMQLLSILITCFVISSAVLIFVFGANDIDINKKPNFDYLVISITILFIGNVVVFFNLFARIFAVVTGNDENFIISPEKRMEGKIRKQLKRYRESLSLSPVNSTSSVFSPSIKSLSSPSIKEPNKLDSTRTDSTIQSGGTSFTFTVQTEDN